MRSPLTQRVNEPGLIYGTDEETWGSDPRARRFDFGADPLNYADSQMRLVQELRTKILERMVEPEITEGMIFMVKQK